MAQFNDKGAVDFTAEIPAASDLSAGQYHFVTITGESSSSGLPEIALVSSAGAQADGVLQDKPVASTLQVVRVRAQGISKIVYGGTVTVGTHRIQSAADGEATAASTGDFVLANPIKGGGDQEIGMAVINCPGGQSN